LIGFVLLYARVGENQFPISRRVILSRFSAKIGAGMGMAKMKRGKLTQDRKIEFYDL
jgi:hypothetical protein